MAVFQRNISRFLFKHTFRLILAISCSALKVSTDLEATPPSSQLKKLNKLKVMIAHIAYQSPSLDSTELDII